MVQLSTRDHSRDSAGMTYVYPVISRRAGGVSVGINLNPNNACNWRCVYCQVPDLKRGGPPPLDLAQLESELRYMLHEFYRGEYLALHAPPEAQHVVDIAFSGNGEPTSAVEFPDAVELVARLVGEFASEKPPRLRLITNGSLLDRAGVRRGIELLGRYQGEVWFKLDAVNSADMKEVNGIAYQPATVLRRLRHCAERCDTWVQTCVFLLDGQPSLGKELNDYLSILMGAADKLAGVHLYGLARPSMQAEAYRLAPVEASWLEGMAETVRKTTGLTVKVSP